jgi:hypothetical protein
MRSPFAFLLITTLGLAVCEIVHTHAPVSKKCEAVSHSAACGVLEGMEYEKFPVPLPFEELLPRHQGKNKTHAET